MRRDIDFDPYDEFDPLYDRERDERDEEEIALDDDPSGDEEHARDLFEAASLAGFRAIVTTADPTLQ